MSRNRKMDFAAGIQDGIPICLGYIAVSFTFGIMAKNAGLSTWEAVLISLTNLTSAGQFAGLSLITASASYFEMAFTQLIINLRYSLMSCALSQKIDNHYPFFHRFLIAYGVTDEVFGVSVSRPGRITPWYSYGVMALAAPGWTLGTFLGVVSGNILPDRIVSVSQPFVRPIVRGKAGKPVEFGAKLDISVVDGWTRLECCSFDAYNESGNLREMAERFRVREGHYPSRILADKI